MIGTMTSLREVEGVALTKSHSATLTLTCITSMPNGRDVTACPSTVGSPGARARVASGYLPYLRPSLFPWKSGLAKD